jgi:DNA replication initiation complex subunit (GINS family)
MALEDESFTYETITQVYREERKLQTLTTLPLNFYKKLDEYIKKIRENYIKERQADPNSPKTLMLEDELRKAEKRASEIYERRERKIVILALSAANGVNPNIKVLTAKEKEAFNNIVDTLLRNRKDIFSKKEEDECEVKPIFSAEKEIEKVETTKVEDNDLNVFAEEMGEEKRSDGPIDDYETENPVVLILEDIPSFETKERTFDLKKDDMITLPREYARILCKHKKAKVIQG